jgi:hypothetical protein
MKLFSYIMEFKSNIYITQSRGKDLYDSIINWINVIDYKAITGMGKKSYKELNNLYKDSDYFPVQLNELFNAWCHHILLNKNRYSALINIFLTNEEEFQKIGLYSFLLLYLGGTYISQVKGNNVNEAINNWLQLLEEKEIKDIKHIGKKILKELKIFMLEEATKPKKIENMINTWDTSIKLSNSRYNARIIIIKTKE